MTELLGTEPIAVREPWLRSMLDFYATSIRVQIQTQFQYRAAMWMYTLGMVAEPTIYLVVWTTIARTHGGSVDGVGVGAFAAYYIVWTFVRMMNVVFTPFGWEWRVREGQFSGWLVKPIHPVHYDLASFAGQKVPWLILYLPIAIALSLVFHPAIHPSVLGVVVFFVAIWGAYVIRSMNAFALGMVTFWTTRVGAIFQVWFLAELLLSGRLLPLQLMPHWAQTLSAWLPFKWTFYYPIETLVGHYSTTSLLTGLAMQALWTAIMGSIVLVAWRFALRQYTAVGN
jgi:ABC-2 type transport system permease protein